MIFDRIAILDWSAKASPSPRRPSQDAIWIGLSGGGESYHRTRADAVARLEELIRETLAAGGRLLIGADFPFGYPPGLAAALTGQPRALPLWHWLAAHVEDDAQNRNNRFALAAAINARFPGGGPFWGCPAGLALPGLPAKGTLRHGHGLPERRAVEAAVPRAQPCWKLFTTGSVGSQALLGIPAMARLRAAFPGKVAVWPFEPWAEAPVVLAEVYPSLLDPDVKAAMTPDPTAIKDQVQVRLLAQAFARLDREGTFAPLFHPPVPAQVLAEQGWILGAGHEGVLRRATAPQVGGTAQTR